MTIKLNLMPGESLNGLYLRDAVANGRLSELRSGQVWVSGFLNYLRLFTTLDGNFFRRYIGQLRQIDLRVLENEHTLIPLFRPVDKGRDVLRGRLISTDLRDVHLTEVRSVSPVVCVDCYRQQVEENGFFWLKIAWQNPYSPYCFIHDRTLINIAPLLSIQYSVPHKSSTQHANRIDSWFDNIERHRKLDEDSINLYLWFNRLYEAKLPNLNIRRLQAILARSYFKIYGTKHTSKQQLVIGLSDSFDKFTLERSGEYSSKYKWFYHPNYNARYVSRLIEDSWLDISTSHFWTLVYVAYKCFDLFVKDCEDILCV